MGTGVGGRSSGRVDVIYCYFFFNDTATTEIYTEQIVGSVRCVEETDANACYESGRSEEFARLVDGSERAHAAGLIVNACLLYTSPSPRDRTRSRMPSSA